MSLRIGPYITFINSLKTKISQCHYVLVLIILLLVVSKPKSHNVITYWSLYHFLSLKTISSQCHYAKSKNILRLYSVRKFCGFHLKIIPTNEVSLIYLFGELKKFNRFMLIEDSNLCLKIICMYIGVCLLLFL